MYYYCGYVISWNHNPVQQLWWILFFIKHQTINIRLNKRDECQKYLKLRKWISKEQLQERILDLHMCYCGPQDPQRHEE